MDLAGGMGTKRLTGLVGAATLGGVTLLVSGIWLAAKFCLEGGATDSLVAILLLGPIFSTLGFLTTSATPTAGLAPPCGVLSLK